MPTYRIKTDWQREMFARLDAIDARLPALPDRIAKELRYGRLGSYRRLVDVLDQPRNAGSSHGTAEKLIGELAEDVAALVAPFEEDS